MPRRIEFHVDEGLGNGFFVIPGGKWRDAKRLVKECKEELHPKIKTITRAEITLSKMYDHDLQGYEDSYHIDKIKYKQMYTSEDPHNLHSDLVEWEDF